MNNQPKPLSFARSLPFFVLPSALMIAMFWGAIRLMDLMGIRLFITFLTALGLPFLLLLLLAIRFYRNEGNAWQWNSFANRFRLRRMNGMDWLRAIVLAGVFYGTFHALAFTTEWINELIPQPKYLVRMLEQDPNYFMELPWKRNWWILAGMLFFTSITILGEELWFRGYILPRQESVHGRWGWLIHGLLWLLFRLFMPWDVIRLIPGAFAVSFVAQRSQNTWPGIIARFAAQVPVLFTLISGIVGAD